MPGAGASARKRRGGASWLLLWSCWAHVSHSTLVAHYSFDDGTATEDSDSSLDGTITGATPTTGLFGSGALSFDGSDDYVEFPAAVTANILVAYAATMRALGRALAHNHGLFSIVGRYDAACSRAARWLSLGALNVFFLAELALALTLAGNE